MAGGGGRERMGGEGGGGAVQYFLDGKGFRAQGGEKGGTR